MDADTEVDDSGQAPSVLTAEQERDLIRARRDIKLVGIAAIGLIGLMIVGTIIAVLLTYGD